MKKQYETTLTDPSNKGWSPNSDDYACWEKSRYIGQGVDQWRWATAQLLSWGIKTRSGFRVTPAVPVVPGQEPAISVHALGMTVLEPVRVVAVVNTEYRVGFAYQTLPGHPVRGEEAFILERRDENIFLTIRSLTKPSSAMPWRVLYPLLRVAQVVARWRYFRALKLKS
ncbi:DUF1990 family protein [Glutamicibacter sp.]|uniref:DUF1990 family protein n=1 Tax=Glutamicibacter sp. TaxID=1931995 RepID=UPI002B460B39|nr:DUF1990 domain-containing protein [Glutamicibacter sp.]HJX78198.1 DUF1990 domain-containing protein [Glutamicibacter sp.]